jgi:tRNA (guanine-N7-)-methyltransferase
MARLRKASRAWRDSDAREAAARVMVPCDNSYFTIEPERLFGRHAPLEIEIGAGRGDFIIERAAAMPERDFLAVELAGAVAQLMAVRAGRRGLANLRVVRMDARPLANLMLAESCVAAYHIYFPDPWPKERHLKHRLFTPYFAASIGRNLADGAPLFVATDVADYADAIFAMAEAAGLERMAIPVPGASETGFARKFIAAGMPVYAGAFVRPR